MATKLQEAHIPELGHCLTRGERRILGFRDDRRSNGQEGSVNDGELYRGGWRGHPEKTLDAPRQDSDGRGELTGSRPGAF